MTYLVSSRSTTVHQDDANTPDAPDATLRADTNNICFNAAIKAATETNGPKDWSARHWQSLWYGLKHLKIPYASSEDRLLFNDWFFNEIIEKRIDDGFSLEEAKTQAGLSDVSYAAPGGAADILRTMHTGVQANEAHRPIVFAGDSFYILGTTPGNGNTSTQDGEFKKAMLLV